MKGQTCLIVMLLCVLSTGCVTKFIPEVTEDKNLLVVEGLMTDQNETYTVKLSRSNPLGETKGLNPVPGAEVTIADDFDNIYSLSEISPGIYRSDSASFTGLHGRKYSLHVSIAKSSGGRSYYESTPAELIPVPLIDSIFFEKVTIKDAPEFYNRIEDCQIYIDTHDATGKCQYFKWDFSETWEFHLHWDHPNKICWRTEKSNKINVKNTTGLVDTRVSKYPLNYIPNTSDKLEVKYSILTSQYSISPEEYAYCEKMKGFSEDVGGLYDQMPAYISGNITCINNPEEQVLGYFSVSGKTSKRIFIKSTFNGQVNLYKDCPTDIIYNPPPVIAGLDSYIWILESHPFFTPPYIVLTDQKACVDCTTRGTNIKPSFWEDK
jgi:hypothetical protein